MTLSAKRITKPTLLSAMTSILKASGCDTSKMLRETKTLLSQIKKSEDKKGLKSKMVTSTKKMLARAKQRMATLEAKGKNKTVDLVKVKKAELKREAAEAELEKAAEKLAPLYDELDKILHDSKVKMVGSLDPSSES